MSNIVKVWNYDKNGEVTAVGDIDLEIFETVPIDATIIQPPKEPQELNPDESLRFDEVNQKWLLEIDPDYTPPEEPTADPNYISDSERITELELALADLMAGGM